MDGAKIEALVVRLRNPPFGTETSERNLMAQAADALTEMHAQLSAMTANADRLAEALDRAASFANHANIVIAGEHLDAAEEWHSYLAAHRALRDGGA